MDESDKLTVGLAVGLPALLGLAVLFIFYYRNRRKQQREDIKHNQIDLELQDNQSFVQFQHELNKTGTTSKVGVLEANGGVVVNKAESVHSSASPSSDFSSGNKNTNTSNSEQLDVTEEDFTKGHNKTNSTYEFYNSFIPILPGEGFKPPASPNKFRNPLHKSTDSMDKMINSSTSSVNDKASYNLAKQLNHQAFFEKLPSRAGTIKPPAIASYNRGSSTSSLELENAPEGSDAINDSYIYRAAPVVQTPTNQSPVSQSPVVKQSPNNPSSLQNPPLLSVGITDFDTSFANDDSDQGDVIFK